MAGGSFPQQRGAGRIRCFFTVRHPLWCADIGGHHLWVYINLVNHVRSTLVILWEPTLPEVGVWLSCVSWLFHKNSLCCLMLQTFLNSLEGSQSPTKQHLVSAVIYFLLCRPKVVLLSAGCGSQLELLRHLQTQCWWQPSVACSGIQARWHCGWIDLCPGCSHESFIADTPFGQPQTKLEHHMAASKKDTIKGHTGQEPVPC